MRRRWLPQWVSEFRDRHGKSRYRFRRKGFATYCFKSAPGSEAFRQEYQACLDGIAAERIAAGAERIMPGSFDDLISRYYRSPEFLDPSERTRTVYRGVIERWRAKYGTAKVRDLEARHIGEMMAEMHPYKTAANMLRKRLRALMAFAVREGLTEYNPVLATKPFKVKGNGFHSWTEEEIETYEKRHPIGTMARLTFDLLIWTGQRPGDVRVMGPQHFRNKRLFVTQEKTGTDVSLPILAPLAESIIATKSGAMLFIVSGWGREYSRKGFGNKFRQWADEANLKHCSAHGLRKAASRRFAEAGASNQEIKAWTGHKGDSEVARYTAAASQELLSNHAAELLMANHRTRLANSESKSLKKDK